MIADLPTCPAPGAIIEIAAPELSLAGEALTFILEPLRPLREPLIAMTGIGLDAEIEGDGSAIRRYAIPQAGAGHDLAVLAAGPPMGRRVVFIHGSPGLGEEWLPFLTDVPQGRLHLAPDRPGFGESGSEPVTALQQQADALVPLLGSALQVPVVLVGYSYGGPVALRLAADHPDRVAGLLLIGAAADPGLEEIHPLQEVAALDFFQQLLPTELANSNAELMALQDGLEALQGDLARIRMPVTVVQGTADTLVPPSNADFLRAHLPVPPSMIMVEGEGHFLPWTHGPLLTAALDCLMQGAQAQLSGPSDR